MFPKPPGIPVFVMLPLDSVSGDGAFKYASAPWFAQALHLLANSGAYGVAVDVWWGAVEREAGTYTWTGYKQLLELIRPTGLKLQIVLSFHACGGNVGDTAHIPLPPWVLRCGENDPDLFFTDRPRGGSQGQRNREYLSVWADDAAGVLQGRSPMQCYEDFMASFRDKFFQDLGSIVEEVVVGAGPCGELRFPSYVEANGWRFPGVGEFQCYDRRALASLAAAARERGCPEWGFGGPHDTGDYNSNPEDTGFYNHEGSWDSPYGRFFLDWYSCSLMQHGDRLMGVARRIFSQAPGLTAHKAVAVSSPSRHSSAQQLADPGSCAQPSSAQPQQEGPGWPERQAGQGQAGGGSSSRGAAAAAAQRPASTASDAVADGEQSDMSSMSLPDQDGDSVGHPSSDRSSVGMARGLAEASAVAACTSGPAPSLGTISQHSDSTDVITAVHPPSLTSSSSAQAAADRSCSTVHMFNLLVDETSDCMTPDNASAGAAEEAQPSYDSGAAGRGGGGQARRGAGQGQERGQAIAGLAAGGADTSLRQRNGLAQEVQALERERDKELMLTLKIAGIHWWFRSRSHAAELTAGYYNTATRDGYASVVELCAKHKFSLTLTCVEMCDTQHPPPALCGPEGLLKQVRSLCALHGVPLSGENALPIFLVDCVDSTALERIVFNTRVWHGAAAMSAYWSARRLERSPSPELYVLSRELERGSGGGRGGARGDGGWRALRAAAAARRAPAVPVPAAGACGVGAAAGALVLGAQQPLVPDAADALGPGHRCDGAAGGQLRGHLGAAAAHALLHVPAPGASDPAAVVPGPLDEVHVEDAGGRLLLMPRGGRERGGEGRVLFERQPACWCGSREGRPASAPRACLRAECTGTCHVQTSQRTASHVQGA